MASTIKINLVSVKKEVDIITKKLKKYENVQGKDSFKKSIEGESLQTIEGLMKIIEFLTK